MNSTNDYSVNRLTILSQDQSYNKRTGALVVKGGISAGKAIRAPCIVTDKLTITDTTTISGDLTLDNLTVNETTTLKGNVTLDTLTIDKIIPKYKA